MMHFVRTFRFMLAQGVRNIAFEEVGNHKKLHFSKALLKTGGGTQILPRSAPGRTGQRFS